MSPNPLLIKKDITQSDLERISEFGIVSVDTELTGLNPHRDKLCLLQLCDPNKHVYLIRSEDWGMATNLRKLFEDEKIIKIFHFALIDCSFIQKNLKTEIKTPYCTKIASKIARTYTSEHSLKSLIKELLKIEIDKSQQTTDWDDYPFTENQLKYAASDVEHLLGIKNELERKLKVRGSLPTGITYFELNNRCQSFIPALVHLFLNGWDLGFESSQSLFSH